MASPSDTKKAKQRNLPRRSRMSKEGLKNALS